MSTSYRFHLKSIVERQSPSTLKKREEAFLAGTQDQQSLMPAPHHELMLVVVIPAFNEADSIDHILQCLEIQRLPACKFEVIVVDNDSSDGTPDVVRRFSETSRFVIHLLSEEKRGCLQAVQAGMHTAVRRMAHVLPPERGLIACIDADDTIDRDWISAGIRNATIERADLIRGPAKLAKSLSEGTTNVLKILCDIENQVNGYTHLARVEIQKAIKRGKGGQRPALWLPRITGPNLVIQRSAYVAVGGLDPRPPGDQASALGNPLLQRGCIVSLCDDPRMTLFRSSRASDRGFAQASGFGVGFGLGFGEMIAQAQVAADTTTYYPNPQLLEGGLRLLLTELQSPMPAKRRAAQSRAAQYLSGPPDPNPLYEYGKKPNNRPALVPLSEAQKSLRNMIARAGGMDYERAEMFLRNRQQLRKLILDTESDYIYSYRFVANILRRLNVTVDSLSPRLFHIATALSKIPDADPECWFDDACYTLERIYTGQSYA